MLQVEKQLDFRAEREGRDKRERDDKKRAFKNLVRPGNQNTNKSCVRLFFYIKCFRRRQKRKRRRSERRKPS